MQQIFISVWVLTHQYQVCSQAYWAASWPQPCPLINHHVMVSIYGWQMPTLNQSSLPCQKCALRVVFYNLVHAVRVRIAHPVPTMAWNIQLLSCVWPLIPFGLSQNEVQNCDNCRCFSKNDNFTENVLWEISGACVDTKLSDIKATCFFSDNNPA